MSVEERHDDWRANEELWTRSRDASAGQNAIKKKRETYLPRLGGQDATDYDAFLNRAHFFGATGRTVDGLIGMIFRIDPVVDAPSAMDAFIEDVTQTGVPFVSFAQSVTDEVITVARCGVLVDFPRSVETEQSQLDVEAEGNRPFWRLFTAEAIRNWKTKSVNNRRILTEVRLDDTKEVEGSDEFDTTVIPIIRVLDLNPEGQFRHRVFVEDKTAGNWIQDGADIIPLMQGEPLRFIPFVFIGPRDLTPDVNKPPICDLVDANISHYQLNADYRHGLHFAALPTPWIAGVDDEDETRHIGPTEVWRFGDPNTRVGMLEFTGSGMEAVRLGLKDLEGHMAVLGARMLAPEKRAAEAAETASIHRAGEQSSLATIANTISMGISDALRIGADWMGRSEDVGAELNTDFMPVPMAPDELRELMKAWQGGAIAWTDFVRKLQKGEVVAADRTPDDIRAEIETDPPAQPLVPSFEPDPDDQLDETDDGDV